MKRSPMPVRKAYMKRARMKRRPAKPRKGADPARLAFIRTLPCCCPLDSHDGCGRVQAHHAGRRPGVGIKAPDDTVIPLGAAAHEHWHRMTGPFADMDRAQRREWSDARIEWARAMYERVASMPPLISTDEYVRLRGLSRMYCHGAVKGAQWCYAGCMHSQARDRLYEYRGPVGCRP